MKVYICPEVDTVSGEILNLHTFAVKEDAEKWQKECFLDSVKYPELPMPQLFEEEVIV